MNSRMKKIQEIKLIKLTGGSIWSLLLRQISKNDNMKCKWHS